MHNTNPCVLIAPLNWGLGHASRCIPIINELIKQNCRVVLCGNGESLKLLSNEFPELEKIELHNYVVSYSQSKRFFLLRMLFHLPSFFKSIKKDKKMAEIISRKIQPTLIISDNRYGFRSKNIFSVLLTHQIKPLLPHSLRMFQKMFTNRIFAMMSKFHQVWVPDYENEPNLSGILSHNTKFKGNLKFCEPLSRCKTNIQYPEKEFDIMCILSGPEPQKSFFENYCFTLAKDSQFRFCIAAGKPSESKIYETENIVYYSNPSTDTFDKLLNTSKCIVSRSGYSTIMDLHTSGVKGILIPTPGQTEQEYLAKLHNNKGQFVMFNPAIDNFHMVFEQLMLLPQPKQHTNSVLHQVIKETLDRLS